ncbi:MAG: hypothetical protein ABI992_09490, partial [Chthoniobacterales bacterium]
MKKYSLGVILAVAAALLYVVAPLFQHDRRSGFDLEKFGQLPVLLNGRIKPLDTVARNSLLIIHGNQTLRTAQGELTPMDWFAEVLFKSDDADQRKIFVIRNLETRAALGRAPDAGKNGSVNAFLAALGMAPDPDKYWSFREFFPHLQQIEQQATLAQNVDAQLRSPFQRDITKLYERVSLYHRLENSLEFAGTEDFKTQLETLTKTIKPSPIPMQSGISAEALQSLGELAQTGYFFPIPPQPPNDEPRQWQKMGDAILKFVTTGEMHPAVTAYAAMASAYNGNDAAAFDRTVSDYAGWLQQHFPERARKAKVEWAFNKLQLFYSAMVLYVLIFLLACTSWLIRPQTFGRYAYALLL